MSVIFELSTTDYSHDTLNVKKAMSHLETLCGAQDGCMLGPPEQKAGWSFFKIKLSQDLYDGIAERFSDMIDRHRWSKPEEKFRKFLEQYLQTRGCTIRIKIT